MPDEDKAGLVAIDEDNLDREWIQQPALVYQYAAALAAARLDHARAKANLDVVAAECRKRIRSRPDVYHIDKVTESTVDGAVVMTTEHKEAMEQLNKAKYKLDMVQAMMDALDHKKQGLENLVKLHGQNYFSKPKASLKNQQKMDADTQKHVVKKLQGKKGQ